MIYILLVADRIFLSGFLIRARFSLILDCRFLLSSCHGSWYSPFVCETQPQARSKMGKTNNFKSDFRGIYNRHQPDWANYVHPQNRQATKRILKNECWDDVSFPNKKVKISRYDGGSFTKGAVRGLFFRLVGKHRDHVLNAFRIRFGNVPNMTWILRNLDSDRNNLYAIQPSDSSRFFFDDNDILVFEPGRGKGHCSRSKNSVKDSRREHKKSKLKKESIVSREANFLLKKTNYKLLNDYKFVKKNISREPFEPVREKLKKIKYVREFVKSLFSSEDAEVFEKLA